MRIHIRWTLLLLFLPMALPAKIQVGAEVFFEGNYLSLLKGKRVGIITNHSAINPNFQTTLDLLKKNQNDYSVVAIFAPEHGFYGNAYAFEDVADQCIEDIPVYALYGKRRRPTAVMLSEVDLLICDIQDIGTRSYSFISTLFYCMEEAAKAGVPLVVLDRPNPMGGCIVDGPPVEERWRSFIGYINVPYCHGMTVGELAKLFNEEYHVGCQLTVIPMKGWNRSMVFAQTGLPWIPTSPQIPEADTSFFYPMTGLIGHCSITNIGVGYTLPFKIIGAPWIDAYAFADNLNKQGLPGVYFQPFFFKPFFGKFKGENCAGVLISVTDPVTVLPVSTQFTIMGVLKNLYPKHFSEAMERVQGNANKRDVFNKLNGGEEVLRILIQEKYIIWSLRQLCAKNRESFLCVRKKYLLPEYN